MRGSAKAKTDGRATADHRKLHRVRRGELQDHCFGTHSELIGRRSNKYGKFASAVTIVSLHIQLFRTSTTVFWPLIYDHSHATYGLCTTVTVFVPVYNSFRAGQIQTASLADGFA